MKEQSPQEELADRAAELIPGIRAAAAAVGLQDHQRLLHDHAARIRADYARGAKAMGGEPVKDDDMASEIIITGDINAGNENGNTLKDILSELRKTKPNGSQPTSQPSNPIEIKPEPTPQPQPQQPTQPQIPAAAKTRWQKLWPWLLAAAVPASGAGGAAVANWISKPTPATDTWIEWDFKATQPQGEPEP